MKEYIGKSVFSGVAIGKIKVFQKNRQPIIREKINDVESEISRYYSAVDTVYAQLGSLYEKAIKDIGEENAEVFKVHQMLLRDEEFSTAVIDLIKSLKVNAEYAVAATAVKYASVFTTTNDKQLEARTIDLRDIAERMVDVLSQRKAEQLVFDEPVIIVADDLTPSETVQMDRDKILAFVTVKGSPYSHSAIFARTMSIPYLISTSVEIDESLEGKMGIVDAESGVFYIEPDSAKISQMHLKQADYVWAKQLHNEQKGKETVTLDGKQIKLYANIGNIKDLDKVKQNDSGGIGLFRTEFIYLEKNNFPTEEELFEIYKTVVEEMAGKKVIFRTLDIGADKQCDYFNMEHEENPALGYRAIRICLNRPEIFKPQLRALYRASLYGNASIMFPMIISLTDVRRIKGIIEEVKAELDAKNIAYGNPEIGIMVETPAAVWISRDLAKEVDFLSIGTNDLTQYTLAIDRQNSKLAPFYDDHHPAIMEMIRMVVENAHAEGIWAGICGELAADMRLTDFFVKMGVDELSVSPDYVLPMREIIRNTRIK